MYGRHCTLLSIKNQQHEEASATGTATHTLNLTIATMSNNKCNGSSNQSTTKIGQQQSSSSEGSAYTAYNAVDALVAKPVLGSDGAAKWQEFRQQQPLHASLLTSSVAPTAPLKATDRAAGFQSWKQERDHADQIRAATTTASAGIYTHFKKKADANNISANERKRIENRLIGDDQEYFISSSNKFAGWKWDYVFTTKSSQGTGYYFDGMDSLKQFRGELSRPDETPTNSTVIGGKTTPNKIKKSKSDVSETLEDSLTGRPKPKKRKSNAVASAVTIVNDPTHPLEQVAAALQQQQKQHALFLDLPSGWEAATVADGQTFYYNRTTGERTWEKPPNNNTVANAVSSAGAVIPWRRVLDPVTSQHYYYHAATGETTWEKPVDGVVD